MEVDDEGCEFEIDWCGCGWRRRDVGVGMGMGVDVDVGGFVGAFLGWLGEELKAHYVCVITERALVLSFGAPRIPCP